MFGCNMSHQVRPFWKFSATIITPMRSKLLMNCCFMCGQVKFLPEWWVTLFTLERPDLQVNHPIMTIQVRFLFEDIRTSTACMSTTLSVVQSRNCYCRVCVSCRHTWGWFCLVSTFIHRVCWTRLTISFMRLSNTCILTNFLIPHLHDSIIRKFSWSLHICGWSSHISIFIYRHYRTRLPAIFPKLSKRR